MTRVLFVCSRNRWRSPTAEAVFAGRAGIDSLSAGLNHDAETPITNELVAWAEVIFVMESNQKTRLASRFGQLLRGKRVVCLGIADRYRFMDPALVQILERKVGPILERAT